MKFFEYLLLSLLGVVVSMLVWHLGVYRELSMYASMVLIFMSGMIAEHGVLVYFRGRSR